MSFTDPTNQGIEVFIRYLDSLSEPDLSNPGTRALKSAATVTVPATVKIQDTAGNSLTSTAGALDVNIVSGSGGTTIADGADVTQGAIADAIVLAGAVGTVSAKLRRLTADLDTIKTTVSTSALQTAGNASLSSIDTKLTSPLPVTSTSTSRVPSLLRPVMAGTVAAGKQSVSFYNAGTTDATVLGTALKQGEEIDFVAKGNDTIAAITYDPQVTDLLISILT